MTDASVQQVRGSSLLLAGRVLSLGANFAVQVLVVRYLAKEDYGAFAWALSIALVAQSAVTLGLDRAVTRFLAIYDESGDLGRLFGTVVLAATTILGLGLAAVLLVVGLQGLILGTGVAEPQAVALLAILIVLAPLQALDELGVALLAVFARPRAIFVRRYIVSPGLRVVVVLLLVASDSRVEVLAAGYVLAALVGVLVYGGVVVRLLVARGLRDVVRERRIRVPAREVFAFALPLLSTDLLYISLATTDVLILGAFHGSAAVAELRAVQPVAALNQVVFTSFALLYTPLASRLFARRDRHGSRELYWQTALWMAVLTFPVFAVTFALAERVTLTLFGPAYAGSGIYLAILAVGYYANSALGFNGLTLKVHGHVRTAMVIDLTAAGTNLALNLALIPPLGPLGAAIGTAATLVVHNVLKQLALHRRTGIALFDRRGLPVYAAIVGVIATLAVVVAVAGGSLPVGVALAAAASFAVLAVGRRRLRIAEAFPEVLRIPLARRLLA